MNRTAVYDYFNAQWEHLHRFNNTVHLRILDSIESNLLHHTIALKVYDSVVMNLYNMVKEVAKGD